LGIRSDDVKGSRRENNGILGMRHAIQVGQGAKSCPAWMKKSKRLTPKAQVRQEG